MNCSVGTPAERVSIDEQLLGALAQLERVKRACSAVQARLTHAYSEARLAGITPGSRQDTERRREIGSEVARARGESPFQGSRHLELSRVLVRDLPHTLDALAAGDTTEYRCNLIARASTVLGTVDRWTLDSDLGPRLAGLSNRRVESEANRLAAQLDPPSVVERHRRAVAERRVTTRPAPDAMTWVTALLPVADGVAVHAALDRYATTMVNAGDPRTRGQLMADEFTRRISEGCCGEAPRTPTGNPKETTNASRADRAHGSTRQIDLLLVMSDRALLDGADTPAVIPGHDSIPAALARDMLAQADRDTQVWLRRLYTDAEGALATADSRARRFPFAVRQFVLARDERCRTPFCDAPIRDIDHDLPYSAGGSTTLANAQGLCRSCNLVKGATSQGVIGQGVVRPALHPVGADERRNRPPGPPIGWSSRRAPSDGSGVPDTEPGGGPSG